MLKFPETIIKEATFIANMLENFEAEKA